MKIGIDARSILNPERSGGVGTGHYTYHLLRKLKEIDKENEYVVMFDSTVREKDIQKFEGGNFSVRFFPYQKYGKFLPNIYKDIMLSGFINREKLDILHIIGMENTIPPKFSGRVVLTSRGIGRLKMPELYPPYVVKKARMIKKIIAENAENLHMIVSSQELKDDTAEFMGIPKEKISVVYEGMDKRLCDSVSEDDIARIKKKYNLGNHGILYMGTIEPVKNISRIMEAYKKLREKSGLYYKLIIAGKDGWMAKELRSMAIDLGIEDDITFLGYIPPEDLSALFSSVCLFVFAPLYEGFGTPAVEAMACGLPIVASDIPVLHEIAGDAAVFANPFDTEGIADAMAKVLNNKGVEKNSKENGQIQIEKFCWEKTARETLEVYKRVAKL